MIEWNGADPKECAWAEREMARQQAERNLPRLTFAEEPPRSNFIAGWRYFWDVAERPWIFMLGFFVAAGAVNLVVTSFIEIGASLVKEFW